MNITFLSITNLNTDIYLTLERKTFLLKITNDITTHWQHGNTHYYKTVMTTLANFL